MKQVSQKVLFHYLTKGFLFRERNRLKNFLLKQLKDGGKKIETINYIFCDDAYLLSINEQYLNHNTYTDIVTFELSNQGLPLIADVYISIDRVRENALIYHSSFKHELHRVIFHGALHLLGFKDKNAHDARLMREAEDAWLSGYFVPREMKTIKD